MRQKKIVLLNGLVSGQKLIFLIILFCFWPLFSQETSMESSQTSFSSYPKWLYDAVISSHGWTPTLKADSVCERQLKLMTTQSGSSTETLSAVAENCRLDHKSISFFQKILASIYVDFDVHSLQFQKLIFHLQKGSQTQADIQVRGTLMLQKQNQQVLLRPLVILRMGIHGNIDEFFAERFIAKILYENLGYHVLVLESLTSHGYLSMNEVVTAGGIEEGLHTFFILKKIRQKKYEWAKNINKIYLVGVSLGGLGSFVTQYLDEESKVNGQASTQLSAVQLFCPLVNFEKTFEMHSTQGFKQMIIDVWNRRRFLALRQKIVTLDQMAWWKTLFDWKPRFTPILLSELNRTRAQPLLTIDTFQKEFKDLKLPSEFLDHVKKSHTLFELNDFWSIYKNKKTSVFVTTTPNDPLVMNYLNSDLIKKHVQSGIFQKMTFQELQGVHCALAPEYQWPFLVDYVRQGFGELNK